MSRTLKIETQIKDPSAVMAALNELGYVFRMTPSGKLLTLMIDKGEFTRILTALGGMIGKQRGFQSEAMNRFSFVIDKEAKQVNIHVDDWDVERFKPGYEKMIGLINQHYAKHKILQDAKKQGFEVKFRTRKDGFVEMVAKQQKTIKTTIRCRSL